MSQEGGPDKNDDSEKGRGRKVPSGFEKILKRTRRGITHDKEKEAKESADAKDDEKKAAEEESKEEDHDQDKEESKKKKKKSGSEE